MRYLIAYQKRLRFVDERSFVNTTILDHYPTKEDLDDIRGGKHLWEDSYNIIAISELRDET